MKALKDKHGDTYIYLCVIVVFLCLLVSVIILYMGLTAQVQIQKRDVQAKLDSYVSLRATDEYDALKQGSVKDNYFDWVQIETEAYEALGFSNETDEVYVYENKYYEEHIQEELETALSIVTTSYMRNDDIVTAVRENIEYLKPPVKDIFASFLAESTMISANTKQSIKHLKEKINNSIFAEWCDTLVACQDDRTLKETLMPIVGKLTDVRIANGEIKAMLSAARIEYYMMAGMVVANIPLLYVLNKDWYAAIMYTTLGKIILAICGMAILVTYLFMTKFTKPIEYRK